MALVGKGVTYDSGGYDVKVSGGMYRMYGDMAGAAAVLGTLRTVAKLGVKLNVVGIMPLAENMISGRAYKAGDIFVRARDCTSRSRIRTPRAGCFLPTP